KTGGLAKTFTILNSITEFRGPVSSTGSTERVKAGPGRLIFSADNSYTGATRIAEGVLQVGTGGDAGTLGGGSVVNNGTLEINRSGFLSISGVISGSGTLIHSGPGETILSLAQTYTGDTVITNGTLSPTFLTFDDASAIFISGSGKLDLFEEATDLIADLYLDGERQEAGLYGAPGAKVAYGDPDIIETPFLTGAGLLEVRAAGSAYEEWVAQFTFENEGDEDPDVDANGNGINNRGEF